jgi:hypothetical protein
MAGRETTDGWLGLPIISHKQWPISSARRALSHQPDLGGRASISPLRLEVNQYCCLPGPEGQRGNQLGGQKSPERKSVLVALAWRDRNCSRDPMGAPNAGASHRCARGCSRASADCSAALSGIQIWPRKRCEIFTLLRTARARAPAPTLMVGRRRPACSVRPISYLPAVSESRR